MIDGEPVIPGATLRGLVRSTMEIAAMARLEQVDRHKRFGIRDFGHELFKDGNRPRTNGGWLIPTFETKPGEPISKVATGAVLWPCDLYRIRIRELPNIGETSQEHLRWLSEIDLVNRYKHVGMEGKEGKPIDFEMKFDFEVIDEADQFVRPVFGRSKGPVQGTFVLRLPFQLEAERRQEERRGHRDLRRGQTENDCRVGFAGCERFSRKKRQTRAQEKIRTCVRPGRREFIVLSPEAWNCFQDMNCSPSMTRPMPEGNWKKLKPIFDKGNRIPVFWVGSELNPDQIEFGLVKVFKRSHRHSVGDKIPPEHRVGPDTPPDFVSALFGLVQEGGDHEETIALKSRISFGFAHVHKGCWEEKIFPTTIQAQPKASFGPLYLRGTPKKDWSADESTIAGRKRYKAFSGNTEDVEALIEAPDGTTFLTGDKSKWRVQTSYVSGPPPRSKIEVHQRYPPSQRDR